MGDPPGTDTKFPEGYCLGHYEILRLLGSGAFADVYLARHRLLDKEVALKVVRSAEAEAWEQQGAKIMCRLQHPSIVNVHFADRVDGRLVIAMDYVAGKTLREILQERQLGQSEALEIATSLAEALDYFHTLKLEAGWRLAHLDLKPSNILVDSAGTARITDFGMAQMLHLDDDRSLGGSPAYMAPEQFEGKPSQQSDLWAVGALLFEMLLGHTPFRAQSLEEYRNAICTREPEFGPDFAALPAEFREIIGKCLQRNPGSRYATAKELAHDLSALVLDAPLRRCPDCGAALLPDSGICPECTLAEEKKKSQAFKWQAERRPHRQMNRRLASLAAFAFLLLAAALSYGAYRWWNNWRPRWIAQKAVEDSARPGIAVVDKEAIVQEALGRLAEASARAALEDRLRRLKLANDDWQKIQALEKSLGGEYEERIQGLKRFTDLYPDMTEARYAREKLGVWENESRAFKDADTFEKQSGSRMCEILGRWQDFHAHQQTGFRRAYAWDRIQQWAKAVETYAGYAELTVKSAAGLPPTGGLIAGGSQPHAHFVILERGKVLYRSRTMEDNPAPIWDEKIRVMIRPGSEMILEIREDTLMGHTLLLHQALTPFPIDGPFRLSANSIEANLEIRREK